MKKVLSKVNKSEKGFTLTELLIVIVILGVLSSVVAYSVGGFLGSGTEKVAKAQLSTLQTALSSAMVMNKVGVVIAGGVGEDGDSITLTDDANCKVLGEALGGYDYLHAYIRPDIKGRWTWDEHGVITYGLYSGGGVTYEYTGAGNWAEIRE